MTQVKRKHESDGEEEEPEEKVVLNKDTSVYLKCRQFAKMDVKKIQEFVESKSIDVVVVNKKKANTCFVDVGSKEKVAEAVKALQGIDLKGSVVVANVVQPSQPLKKKTVEELRLLDKMLVLRGVTKGVSKKVLRDVFKKAESIFLPCQKADALREAIVLFKSAEATKSAVAEYQGCELMGGKLVLQAVAAVDAGEEMELTVPETDAESEPEKAKNSKSHKQERNAAAKNKNKKVTNNGKKETQGSESSKKKKVTESEND